MIAWLSAPLSVVLVFSPSKPPGAECGRDLACTAKAHTEAARRAADPGDKALHLLTAARSHLALFHQTGKAAQLCQGRRLIIRAGGLPHDHLGDRPATTKREIDAELKDVKVECGRAAGVGATPPDPETPAVVDTHAEVAVPDEATPPNEKPKTETQDLLAVGLVKPASAVVPPSDNQSKREPGPARTGFATPSPVPDRTTVAPRPGQKLLITGGVLLGSAALAGGFAGIAHTRVEAERTQARELAGDAAMQGYTDPQAAMAEQEAEASALRWRRTMIVTSVASGVLGVAAVALMGAGLHVRRPHKNVALRPTLTGVLFTARF